MNEGMAMYLQMLWDSQRYGIPMRDQLFDAAAADRRMRTSAGPPANYDPATFGEGNIYYIPALMWDELRRRIGDQEFWSLARAWPRSHDDTNASYDDITAWWSDRTGLKLGPFFDKWLLGRTSPPSPT
jgi:aminopeptidase N